MPRFAVYSGSTLVGWSELEFGDPPMGVAFGRFILAPEYSRIRAQVVAAVENRSEEPPLTIRQVDGESLESAGGVHITDSGIDDEDIEVSILGLTYPPYDVVFPSHVAAYERQFRDG